MNIQEISNTPFLCNGKNIVRIETSIGIFKIIYLSNKKVKELKKLI